MGLDESLQSVNDAWQNVLQGMQERGLPFKEWADSLDEKGIPSLGVAIGVVLLILLAAALQRYLPKKYKGL